MNEEKAVERVLNKLDKIEERLGSIDKTLVKQEENLAEHMRRTELLETKMEPVEDHVKNVNFLFKIMAGVVAIVGAIAGIIKIFI